MPRGTVVSPGLAADRGTFAASLLLALGGADCLLRVEDVARKLRISRATVYKLVAQGKLAHVRIGNSIRFLPTKGLHRTKTEGLDSCMALRKVRRAAPSWDALYEVASAQEGLFTTVQAADAGYSPQLLQKHLHAGRLHRVRRGVYRLVHFPPGDHEVSRRGLAVVGPGGHLLTRDGALPARALRRAALTRSHHPP